HKTTLVYEYPKGSGDPYYPIPRAENNELYRKYQMLAASTRGVYFTGRLATYKYYNMDQVVAQSLALYAKLVQTNATLAHGACPSRAACRCKFDTRLEARRSLPRLNIFNRHPACIVFALGISPPPEHAYETRG